MVIKDCPYNDSTTLEAICHRSKRLKILMSYIHGVYIDNGIDLESKINQIKIIFNVTAEAIKVD